MSLIKPITNDEILEAVSSYGESGNSQKERVVFMTPRLHVGLIEHLRAVTKPDDAETAAAMEELAAWVHQYARPGLRRFLPLVAERLKRHQS